MQTKHKVVSIDFEVGFIHLESQTGGEDLLVDFEEMPWTVTYSNGRESNRDIIKRGRFLEIVAKKVEEGRGVFIVADDFGWVDGHFLILDKEEVEN